ncbi:unnamed protein product [Prunus armeniaca]
MWDTIGFNTPPHVRPHVVGHTWRSTHRQPRGAMSGLTHHAGPYLDPPNHVAPLGLRGAMSGLTHRVGPNGDPPNHVAERARAWL